MKRLQISSVLYKIILSLVPAIIVAGALFPVFHEILLNPNSFLLIIGNDGIKNYFTYASFIQNNTSSSHFHGMNYPYGESIFYLDSQPVFAFLFYQLRSLFPGIINFSIPFVNYLIIFSPAISAFFLFKIFRHLEVRIVISIIAASGIALLSPQLHRFASHLALSYSFFIPIVIYLVLRNKTNLLFNRQDFSLLLFVLFGYLVHAYIGMICAFITGVYFAISFLVRFKLSRVILLLSKLFFSSVLPTLLFFLLINLSDHHTGRNTNPSGFFTYIASLQSVFLQSEPFSLYRVDGQVSWDQWEGWAYIGIVSVVFILPAYLFLIFSLFWGDKRYHERHISLLILGIVSVLSLLFSFSFPFNQGLEHVVDQFSIIKKFRSVGRFAWIFYYVSGILSVFLINRLSNYSKILRFFFIIFSTLYVIEAIPVYKSYSKFVNKTPNFFRFDFVEENLKEIIKNSLSSDYQAILPLPFYHIGSENYGKTGTDRIYKESMILSYHTNLPLISTYLTHTSIWESKNIMQLLSPPFCRKNIMDNFILDQNVLVYHSYEKLDNYEQSIINKSKLIYSNDLGSIYSISSKDLFNQVSPLSELEYRKLKEDLNIVYESILTSDTLWFFHNGFDNFIKDTSFVGSGSFYGINGNYNLLFKGSSTQLIKGIPYVLSYWKYNGGPNFGQGVLNSLGIITEEKKWLNYGAPKTSHVICGDWSLFELEFVLETENGEIEVYEVDYSKSNLGIKSVIDEVLIYPKGMKVYRELNNKSGQLVGVVINNHPNMFHNLFYSPKYYETRIK